MIVPAVCTPPPWLAFSRRFSMRPRLTPPRCSSGSWRRLPVRGSVSDFVRGSVSDFVFGFSADPGHDLLGGSVSGEAGSGTGPEAGSGTGPILGEAGSGSGPILLSWGKREAGRVRFC